MMFRSLDEMTPQQVHQLYKLRVDVFVAEQNCPFNEIDDQDADPETKHILALLDDDTLAGCARVFPTETGSRFGRFVVHPGHRGSGLGPQIVRAGIEYTEQFAGDLIVEAQSGLVGYYEQFGLVAEGEEFLDTGVPHRRMRLRR
ncbi:GNAT family N-acetyltransferase [Corynebacterium lujinxingii]|uniref:GNAT family N-acetyltransferase n=1 Tax=Corynebacterium lujinxingii TaxID=2763010 RepID=A0A7H0K087_9CORY|nr:GNAT family N-acetyltransferase [Corynebacterium lujinxingii]MBC3179155.1 GNAT family N-acetyltransferase [Corynebacterium lujinxingii]NNO11235.1 GNAT family N-acetyltransferase [Corynebacterium lujinxingii]QNP90703.1 GNAT family N-acetyltransferase [Corynebacterium lujinxingii]